MECLFCQIVQHRAPAKIIYEDEISIAFLDIMPRSTGMCIVASKKHIESWEEDEKLVEKVFTSSQRVAKLIEEKLNPVQIIIAKMPSEIKHFHLRVYPVYREEVPLIEAQPKKVDENFLDAIANKLKEKPTARREKEHEKPKEKERSKDEVYWIKREIEIA